MELTPSASSAGRIVPQVSEPSLGSFGGQFIRQPTQSLQQPPTHEGEIAVDEAEELLNMHYNQLMNQ